MDYKKTKAPLTTVTRDLNDLDVETDNIYQTVMVASKRANQISVEMKQELNRKLVGHYNYFGLRSNDKALHSYYGHAIETAFKWLNRRGGKRSSFNWGQFKAALKKLQVALPRIVEKQRQHVVFA